MHYYERNIGDYHRKAGRLNILQHGVYTLLIDACYDRETFPTTIEEAIDWVWATSPEEIEAVKFVLKKFFKQEDGMYIQKHIQEDLNTYKSFIGKQSDNGKKGGRPKGSKNKKNNSGNDDAGGNPEETQEKPTETQINPEIPNESQEKPKPITIEPSNQEPDGSSGNNACEEKTLPPIQFATYQVHDRGFYSLLEFVNQYSQFQNEFVDLAVPRHENILFVDFQTLMQGYCDFFTAKNDKNTPSIWFVKWLSWIQNNLQDVINRREKQQVPNHQSKQPTGSVQPQKSYFERIADEENENSIRDVTPKKLIGVEEYGHA